jgi:hypothetical protein
MPIFSGSISYAPFPEGFKGDMDETFQQSGQQATIYIDGNFLTGFYYPIGTTPPPVLPTSDQGPIASNGTWYFWDPVTGQYLPQSSSIRTPKNYVRNSTVQIQQTVFTNPVASGITQTYDMCLCRASASSILTIAPDTGPLSGNDNDFCSSSIRYTVTGGPVTTLGVTDLYAHEHLIEGSEIASAQGQQTSLGFSVWVNQPGTYSCYLTSNGRDSSYVFNFQVTTASQWARIKVNNIPPFPTTGTWNYSEGQTGLYIGVVMATGSQWRTSTPGQWVSGFFAGTSSNTNMLSVSNNQMKISAVKLETGSSSTYASVGSFEEDYFGCIRYYFTTFSYGSLTAGFPFILQSQSTNNAMGSMLFERRMCRAPTVVPYGWTSHTAGNVTNMSTGSDVATATLPSTPKGVGGSITSTSNKGDTFACLITADARLS